MYDPEVDRTALVLALPLLTGCQDVLGLARVPDAPAFAPCADRPPSLLCADFDESMPLAYGDGVPTMLPVATAGVSVTQCAPGVSSTSALCIDSQTAPYAFGPEGAGSAVAHLHASFDVMITRGAPYAYEIVGIGIPGNANADCVANLQDDPNQGVRLMTDCAGSRQYAELLPGIPATWAHCELDYDATNARATLAIDDGAPGTVDLAQYTPVAGPAQARVGVLHQQDATGPAVELDNLVVTADP